MVGQPWAKHLHRPGFSLWLKLKSASLVLLSGASQGKFNPSYS